MLVMGYFISLRKDKSDCRNEKERCLHSGMHHVWGVKTWDSWLCLRYNACLNVWKTKATVDPEFYFKFKPIVYLYHLNLDLLTDSHWLSTFYSLLESL